MRKRKAIDRRRWTIESRTIVVVTGVVFGRGLGLPLGLDHAEAGVAGCGGNQRESAGKRERPRRREGRRQASTSAVAVLLSSISPPSAEQITVSETVRYATQHGWLGCSVFWSTGVGDLTSYRLTSKSTQLRVSCVHVPPSIFIVLGDENSDKSFKNPKSNLYECRKVKMCELFLKVSKKKSQNFIKKGWRERSYRYTFILTPPPTHDEFWTRFDQVHG